MATFLPVWLCHWPAISSRAFFRLAAAKTSTSRPRAAAGPRPDASGAPTQSEIQKRRVMRIGSPPEHAMFTEIYRWNIAEPGARSRPAGRGGSRIAVLSLHAHAAITSDDADGGETPPLQGVAEPILHSLPHQ